MLAAGHFTNYLIVFNPHLPLIAQFESLHPAKLKSICALLHDLENNGLLTISSVIWGRIDVLGSTNKQKTNHFQRRYYIQYCVLKELMSRF